MVEGNLGHSTCWEVRHHGFWIRRCFGLLHPAFHCFTSPGRGACIPLPHACPVLPYMGEKQRVYRIVTLLGLSCLSFPHNCRTFPFSSSKCSQFYFCLLGQIRYNLTDQASSSHCPVLSCLMGGFQWPYCKESTCIPFISISLNVLMGKKDRSRLRNLSCFRFAYKNS